MSSSEKIVRQYVRETLIAERKNRQSIVVRGVMPGPSQLPDVRKILGHARDTIVHVFNAVKGLAYAGTAAFKGAESVFKIGAEGIGSIFTGREPDYESIITNQAETMYNARRFLNVDDLHARSQRRQSFFIADPVNESLRNNSMYFLLEQDEESTDQDDDTWYDLPELSPSLPDDHPSIATGPVGDIETPEEVIDTGDDIANTDEEVVEVDPEIPEEPIETPRSVNDILFQIKRSANRDIELLRFKYDQSMNSKNLYDAVSIISPLMGSQGSERAYTPENLAIAASNIFGRTVTTNDVIAGSEDLLSQLKSIIPGLFSGIVGGSLDWMLSQMSTMPEDVQMSIANEITPIYRNEMMRMQGAVE